MNLKNKFDFSFNLTFSISLIVISALMFIASTHFTSVGVDYLLQLVFGAGFIVVSIGFLVSGITNTVIISRNPKGEISSNYIKFNLLFFNATFMVVSLLTILLYYFDQTIVKDTTNFIYTIYAWIILPITVACFILLLLAFGKNRKDSTRRVFIIISALLSTFSIIFLLVFITLAWFLFFALVLLMLFVLHIGLAAYFIINLCYFDDNKQKIIDYRIDNTRKEI